MTQVLADSGAELSREELLDALWLAGRMPRGSGPLARLAAAPEPPYGQAEAPEDAAPSPAEPGPERAEEPHEPATAGQLDPSPAHPVLSTAESAGNTDAPQVAALPVRAPDGRAAVAGELTEVFLGGLMHQLTTDSPDSLPHHRRYDFTGDARRLFLTTVSPKELLRTTRAVTAHIEAAVGRSPVFPAWVGHPDGSAVIGDAGRSFGWLKEELLRRLGITPGGTGGTVPVPGPGTAGAGSDPAPPAGAESGGHGTVTEPSLPRPTSCRRAGSRS